MLRDWTNSDKVDKTTPQAEVFFTRLIMKADDYGCFWADQKRLKANLFPLKSDSIRDADISRWIAECEKAGLIVVYESDDKKYLQIVEFGQRLRTKQSRFPLPDDGNVRTVDSNPPPEVEEEEEVELEEKRNAPAREKKVFNAEEEILKNPIRFEQIVMNARREILQGREILHAYHLYLESKELYPRTKKAIFAGFEKWILDEKKFERNGTYQQPNGTGVKAGKSAGANNLLASVLKDHGGGPG